LTARQEESVCKSEYRTGQICRVTAGMTYPDLRKNAVLILLYMLSLISRPYRPDFARALKILASKIASQLILRCILKP